MLNSIQIGNFKAFADSQRIPIRPLTLIYGANSAGKSSIIHSFVLAREVLEKGNLDVHRTVAGGDSVDLGGFRQYIHRRDTNRRMEWAVELDSSGFTDRMAGLLAPIKTITASIEIGLPQVEEMEEKDGVHPKTGKKIKIKVPTGRLVPAGEPEVVSFSLSSGKDSLIQMSKRRDGRLQLDSLDHEHPIFREVLKAIVETSTTAESIRPSDYEGLSEAISELVPEITANPGRLLPGGLVRPEKTTPGEQMHFFPVSKGRRKEDLAAAVRFFIPRTIDDIIQGVSESVSDELFRLQYLGPLRSYPQRHLAFAQHHDPNWYAGGGYAWDVVRRDERVRNLVNTWLKAPDRLQTPYELIIRELVGLDQIEEPLYEGMEALNESGLDMDHEIDEDGGGSSWPVIKDPEAEAARLREKIRTSDIEKLSELILMDRRSNTIVSHRDVGIGVSQVLPVLVGAYAESRRIMAIEQPEIHLHPAIQADLGDVFVQSALGEQKNKFIIETHSEHLLLRIMRRMRDTFEKKLPDDVPGVTPQEVAVLFVEPVEGKSFSIVREIPLNERGELVKAWPGGFFEEGLREVFS